MTLTSAVSEWCSIISYKYKKLFYCKKIHNKQNEIIEDLKEFKMMLVMNEKRWGWAKIGNSSILIVLWVVCFTCLIAPETRPMTQSIPTPNPKPSTRKPRSPTTHLKYHHVNYAYESFWHLFRSRNNLSKSEMYLFN